MQVKRSYIVVLIALLLLCVIDAQAQCAMCKAAAESDLENNTRSVAGGLNKGILFLMAIPYLVVGVIFRKEVFAFFGRIKENIKIRKVAGEKSWPLFTVSISINKGKKQKIAYALSLSTLAIVVFLLIFSYMNGKN